MFELDRAPSERNLLARPVRKVDDSGGNLSGEADKVRGPWSIGNDCPPVAAGDRPRRFVNVGAQFAAEVGIYDREIIKAASNPPDLPGACQSGEGDVNAPA